MAVRKTEDTAAVEIPKVVTATSTLYVLGTRPLICNRMSEKARHDLLLGGQRKTAVQKQSTIKHDVMEEFRASPYTLPAGSPTLLAVMSSAFKGAMATAALDLPGAKKAQIGRLVWVEDDYTPVYGVPKLFMAVTRSADMNKTPDIRTRAIVPYWAAIVRVSYVIPLITPQAVFNLAVAAGQTVGVGDWRPEKGKGTYGQFAVVDESDPKLQAVLGYGREAQRAAMDDPEPYDQDTTDMLDWWANDPRRKSILALQAATREVA